MADTKYAAQIISIVKHAVSTYTVVKKNCWHIAAFSHLNTIELSLCILNFLSFNGTFMQSQLINDRKSDKVGIIKQYPGI